MNIINLEVCKNCKECDFFEVVKLRDYSKRTLLSGKRKTEGGLKTVCRNWIDMSEIKYPALNFSVTFKWLEKHNVVIVYDEEENKDICPYFLEHFIANSNK